MKNYTKKITHLLFHRFTGLVSLFVLSALSCLAQDTVVTNYPDTDQRWEKIYSKNRKVAENIYHANEQAWMTVQYESKDIEKWKWYYDNGNPYFEATIVNGLLQGEYKIWYEDGQLAEQLFFLNSIENGWAKFYHPNGQIAAQGNYVAGKMVGKWTFYDTNGEPANGNWIWKFAAAQDEIRMTGEVKNGLRIGKWSYRGTANEGRKSQLKFTEVLKK